MNSIINFLNKYGITFSKSINDTISTFIVRASGIIFGVIISIFLGRTLGPKGLGIISLTNQIVGVLLIFSLLGIPTVVVKEVAIAFSRKDWVHANSVVSTSLRINITLGALIIIVGYLMIPYAVKNFFNEPLLKIPLTIALFAMIFQIITRIFAAAINGYRRIWQSSMSNNTASLFVVIVLLFVQYLLNYNFTITIVIVDYAISRVIVTFVMGVYWKTIQHPSDTVEFIPLPILKVALPLLFSRVVGIIATSADIIMIGWLLSAKEVGLYSVAAKIAIVSTIFLQVTNSVIAPKVASMYAEKKIKKMEIMIQKVTKYLTFIAVFIFIFILFGGRFFLSLWGGEFIKSYTVLIVLGFGNFVNISSGAVGLVLTMCNQEKLWGALMFLSALLNIILNYFLITSFGILGASIATAISLIFMNFTAIYLVKKKIGVLTIPLRI